MSTRITITTHVNKPVTHVWRIWTEPAHIMQWNAASDDWHCPKTTNDLRIGGSFSSTMAARDGSFSFDASTTSASRRFRVIAAATATLAAVIER